LTAALDRSLESLRIPNYRRFFVGQLVSISGNWMQTVAEIWVILSLTGSGVAVGLTTALQFLPMLLLGAWGGLFADLLPKRRLLIVTQMLHMLPPLALFALAATGTMTPVVVYAVVFARGVVNAVDYPTRQAFVMEMVGARRVVNAVSLNSVLIHSARIVGPALAGVLIATVGVEPCFALNAASFAVMIAALVRMDGDALRPAELAPREAGAVRAGIRYVRATPQLWIPLGLMAIVGTLGFNFQAILPLLARFSFEGGASAYAALVSAMGIGAVVGALTNGARGSVTPALLVGAAVGFGALSLLAAGAPSIGLELLVLAPLGAASVILAASVNSTLQLASEPAMRGRVMALYSVVFLGTTPIGAPLVGWLAEVAGPRAGLVLSGSAALAAAAGARIAFARNHAAREVLENGPTDGPAAAAARDHDARPRRVRGEGRARRQRGGAPHFPGGQRVRHPRDVGGHPATEGTEAVPGHGDDRLAGERSS
jgi:MFS family permease